MVGEQAVAQDQGTQYSHIKTQLSIRPEEYMKDRVVFKIQIYDRLSKQQKNRYWAASIIGIILAASVPILVNLDVDQIWPTIASLIVTILVSVEKLFHFREHWRNYDEMAAFLRSEQLQFQTRTGEYARKDKAEYSLSDKEDYTFSDKEDDWAFQKFVSRIEQAISNERKDTIEMRTRENAAE